MSMETVKRVTQVSSDVTRGCEHCNFGISHERIDEAINHFISAHGYKLLHVGMETLPGSVAQPAYATVAILGCDCDLPVKMNAEGILNILDEPDKGT